MVTKHVQSVEGFTNLKDDQLSRYLNGTLGQEESSNEYPAKTGFEQTNREESQSWMDTWTIRNTVKGVSTGNENGQEVVRAVIEPNPRNYGEALRSAQKDK